MAVKKIINDNISNIFLANLKKFGEEGLVVKLVEDSLNSEIDNIELNTLELSDNFFSLFRRTGEKDYFILGKALRRASHKIYWASLKKDKDKKINTKFLNLIVNEDGYGV